MDKNIKCTKGFKYHKGCAKMKLTHMCFADDLLVLCNGNETSVKVIKKTLFEFSQVSGLLPNMNKSTIFFGNMATGDQTRILNVLPFQIGKLPVKYLGVPLITKRLSLIDCKQLVDKVKAKVGDWKNKFLSYAGRAQLIASVLSFMQLFWASVFLIPKSTVNDIEKVFKGFLWCQGELTRGKAKIEWNKVCKPKNQGGLGLKSLENWNETLLIKHIWNLATKKDSLWVKWINIVKLKRKSFWEVDGKETDSWM